MKNRYSTLIAIVVVALVGLFTAGRVEAVDIKHTDLHDHLNAIQSQLEQIPPAWSQDLLPFERFVFVFGGAAVLDKETGLVWEQSLDTTARTWSSAQGFCNNRALGGFVGARKGWGLPTIQQLASLVDPTTPPGVPAIAGLPFFSNVVQLRYWSATTDADDANVAWSIHLGVGSVGRVGDKSDSNFVWCVRGGHGGPDAQ